MNTRNETHTEMERDSKPSANDNLNADSDRRKEEKKKTFFFKLKCM